MEISEHNLPDLPGKKDPSKNREPKQEVNLRLPGAFYNDIDPRVFLKKELPWHRQAAILAATGFTAKEISTVTGRQPGYVGNVLRQPYVRETMIREIKNSVQEEMKEFLEAEVMPTLRVMKEIRDDINARKSDRLAASEGLLNRFLGKPTQPITQENKDVSKLSTAELEYEVRRALEGVAKTTGN